MKTKTKIYSILLLIFILIFYEHGHNDSSVDSVSDASSGNNIRSIYEKPDEKDDKSATGTNIDIEKDNNGAGETDQDFVCELDVIICPGEHAKNGGNFRVIIPYFSWSLASVTNNPCNLKYAKQKFSTPYKGFAKFDDANVGFAACIKQVILDQNRGKSLEQFITIYAPPLS